MFRILRQPITITALSLVGLYGLAVYFRIDKEVMDVEMMRVVALICGFLIPHIIVYFLFSAKPRVSNMVITLMILALLADTGTGVGLMFSLGLVTALIKTFVRINRQPMFNPAAAGLLLMSFFGLVTTWWGVSFSPRLPVLGMSVATLITIPVGLWIIWLYKKIPTLVSVIVVFTVVYFLLTQTIPVRLLLEGTFLFFLLFMVTEPKTTPLIDWQEWINGAMIGGLLAFFFVGDVSNQYLIALLSMNLVFAGYKWFQLKMA